MVTGSLLEAREQKNMCSKKILPSMEQDLNWGRDLFSEIERMTGTESECLPSQETYGKSHQISIFDITSPSVQSMLMLLKRLVLKESVMFSGDQLLLERVEEPGTRPEWMLTLKILEPNGGADTEISKTLLSMNLEEVLTLPICSDGLTGIRSLWKQKAVLDRSLLEQFGLRRI